MKIKTFLEYIGSIPKTLYFNLHYFPVRTAIKFPVYVSRHCKLNECNGKIIIHAPIKRGMIRIGFGKVNIFDVAHERSMWSLRDGSVLFNGMAHFGEGSRISVVDGGKIVFGNNFRISANSAIMCADEITFGDDCLLSWDILVMDSDTHKILDNNGNAKVPKNSITIGNHVWIGCRNTILKGSKIPDDSVIAAGSLVTKKFTTSHCVIGGRLQVS